MALAGQMLSHRRHCTHSAGRCSTPSRPSMTPTFLSAPVGQNTAHMRHDLHASTLMDTSPHRRVSTASACGCPNSSTSLNSRVRRSGVWCESVPAALTCSKRTGSACSVACRAPSSDWLLAWSGAKSARGRTETSMARPKAASRPFADAITRCANWPPQWCGHVSQLPVCSTSCLQPRSAISTTSDSSSRPMHMTSGAAPAPSAPPTLLEQRSSSTPPPAASLFAQAAESCRSVGLAASSAHVGQAVAHVPQPMQRAGSSARRSPSNAMAPVVHTSAQRMQRAFLLRTQMQRLGCTPKSVLSMASHSPKMGCFMATHLIRRVA